MSTSKGKEPVDESCALIAPDLERRELVRSDYGGPDDEADPNVIGREPEECQSKQMESQADPRSKKDVEYCLREALAMTKSEDALERQIGLHNAQQLKEDMKVMRFVRTRETNSQYGGATHARLLATSVSKKDENDEDRIKHEFWGPCLEKSSYIRFHLAWEYAEALKHKLGLIAEKMGYSKTGRASGGAVSLRNRKHPEYEKLKQELDQMNQVLEIYKRDLGKNDTVGTYQTELGLRSHRLVKKEKDGFDWGSLKGMMVAVKFLGGSWHSPATGKKTQYMGLPDQSKMNDPETWNKSQCMQYLDTHEQKYLKGHNIGFLRDQCKKFQAKHGLTDNELQDMTNRFHAVNLFECLIAQVISVTQTGDMIESHYEIQNNPSAAMVDALKDRLALLNAIAKNDTQRYKTIPVAEFDKENMQIAFRCHLGDLIVYPIDDVLCWCFEPDNNTPDSMIEESPFLTYSLQCIDNGTKTGCGLFEIWQIKDDRDEGDGFKSEASDDVPDSASEDGDYGSDLDTRITVRPARRQQPLLLKDKESEEESSELSDVSIDAGVSSEESHGEDCFTSDSDGEDSHGNSDRKMILGPDVQPTATKRAKKISPQQHKKFMAMVKELTQGGFLKSYELTPAAQKLARSVNSNGGGSRSKTQKNTGKRRASAAKRSVRGAKFKAPKGRASASPKSKKRKLG